MKYLATGLTGFVGRHLVARLLDDPSTEQVIALVRPGAQLPEDGRLIPVLLEDWSLAGIEAGVVGLDFGAIVHLAAYGVAPGDRDVEAMFAVNVQLPASLAMLAARRGDVSLVTVGSSAEYAPPASRIRLDETGRLETGKLYGGTKAAGWLAAATIATAGGVPLRHLRLFNIYGPGEGPHRLLPSIMRAFTGAGAAAALSDGEQVRDFVHVGDAVEAIVAAVGSAGSGGQVLDLNIASGVGTSVRQFALMAAGILGGDPDALLHFGALERRPDDVEWLVGEPAKARETIGWQAGYGLQDGLVHTINAFREDH